MDSSINLPKFLKLSDLYMGNSLSFFFFFWWDWRELIRMFNSFSFSITFWCVYQNYWEKKVIHFFLGGQFLFSKYLLLNKTLYLGVNGYPYSFCYISHASSDKTSEFIFILYTQTSTHIIIYTNNIITKNNAYLKITYTHTHII